MTTKTTVGMSACVALKVFNDQSQFEVVQEQMYEAMLAKYPDAQDFHWDDTLSHGHEDFEGGLQHYEYLLTAEAMEASSQDE